jgi:hypothetical protein
LSERTATGLPYVGVLHPSSSAAFVGLLLRDLAVLRKEFATFMGRTVMQPLLFVFVFTYVFPKIGQGVGGAAGGEVLHAARPRRDRDRVHLPGDPGGGPAARSGLRVQP